jgi:hypothetical protein
MNARVKCRQCGQDVVGNQRGEPMAHTRSVKTEPSTNSWGFATSPRPVAEICPGGARKCR